MEQKRPRWLRAPFPVSALRCGFVLAVVFAPMTSPAPTRSKVAPHGRVIRHIDVRLKPSKVQTKPLKDPLKSASVVGDSSRVIESFVGDSSKVKTELLRDDSPFFDLSHDPIEDGSLLRLDLADTEKGNTLDTVPITRPTIFVHPDERPERKALKRIEGMVWEFCARIPPKQIPDGLTNGITFVVVSRNSNKGYYATICDGKRMRNSEHFMGESILIGGNAPPEMLAIRLKELAVKGTVFAFGDNDGGTLEQASRKAGLDFVRRGPSLKTDLLKSAQRNRELADRSIDPAQVSFFNGLPATEEGLEAMRFPTTGVEKWQEFHRGVEDRLKGRFATRLTSREELLQELTTGSNDIVTVVAHNDGKTFFINGEELTYRELDGVKSRVSPSERPRLCILISCEAVKISDSEPPNMLAFWRKNRESFAELLVRKGFVDRVFSPDHEIQYEETLRVLDHVKSVEKVRDLELLAGWLHLAELLCKLESEPI
jgi:hypothetical protein